MISQQTLAISSRGRGLFDITAEVERLVAASGIRTGLCNLCIQHTSASLIVSENADPAVGRDLERFFSRLVPDGDALFEHDAEGPDDMPSHVRSVLTATTITLPIGSGRLMLGTWQGVYLWEHRREGQRRSVVVTVYGTQALS